MKKTLLLFFVLGVFLDASAQNTFPATGNVGIGLTTPPYPLTIKGPGTVFGIDNSAVFAAKDTAGNYAVFLTPRGNNDATYLNYGSGGFYIRNNASSQTMFMANSGNVGIGTTNPMAKLNIVGTTGVSGGGADVYANAENSYVGVDASTMTRLGFVKKYGYVPVIASGSTTPMIFGHLSTPQIMGNISSATLSQQVVITPSGYVGIGTSNPATQLAVNGTITAKQVKVTMSGWPDDVFGPAYRSPSLSSLSAYIKSHNHLPGIPAASDIETNGLNLGDMLQKQMQKIEELTLYMISMDKKIQMLEVEDQKLKVENRTLSKEIKHFKTKKP